MHASSTKIEYGDFQTPPSLARAVCRQLCDFDRIEPDTIIEPTCGTGAFVEACAQAFPNAQILGFDISDAHLSAARNALSTVRAPERVSLRRANYFETDWGAELAKLNGRVLVIGNFPWVTNSRQGTIGGLNLPVKSNLLALCGIDAITGKSNFDVSEWMLLDVLTWLRDRDATIAMLCKTAVARKLLQHARARRLPIATAHLTKIDAAVAFGVCVDASLLTMHVSPSCSPRYDFSVYERLTAGTDSRDRYAKVMGHRCGLAVSDLPVFEKHRHLIGSSPVRWRSGIKHDAYRVMELELSASGLINGYGEAVDVEDAYLYPMLKGRALFHGRTSATTRYMLVPQRYVGEATREIASAAPQTWAYLNAHAEELDSRRSAIYEKNPRFSIFGVGEYSFLPWKVAISALHKDRRFRLVGPMGGKPVVFDDTVYFMAFADENAARQAHAIMTSEKIAACLESLTFLDEKRPIKGSSLNRIDWSKEESSGRQLL
jgi:hypothetical protein